MDFPIYLNATDDDDDNENCISKIFFNHWKLIIIKIAKSK